MAIVLRSERNLDSNIFNISDIGPGQYEIENNFDKINNLSKNSVPFNTSGERLLYLDSENSSPGPGSYFKNNYYNNKYFHNKGETTKEHVIKEFPMYNLMSFIKNKKLNDLKTLKIDKRNKSQVQNLKNYNKSKSIEQRKLNLKLLQLKREEKDCTIPSKNQENKEDLMIMPLFSKKNKCKNNITKDDKGFKLDKELTKKDKEILSSNISTNTSSNIYLNKQITTSEDNSNIILSNSSFFPNVNKERNILDECLFFKKLKLKEKKYNSFHKNSLRKNKGNNFKSELMFYNNLLKGDPGPGYYSTSSPFDKYEVISKENKKYNFGSNQVRDILITTPKIKTQSKKVVNDLKLESFNKINKTSFPNLSQSNINLRNSLYSNELIKQLLCSENFIEEINNSLTRYKNKESINVGPGQYDIKSQFNSKNSKKYSFPLSKRFLLPKGKTLPGPGAYLPLKIWNKLSNNIKKNETKIEFREKNKGPDMCTYSPHVIKSIEYDNFINYSNSDNSKAPFGSSQEKILKKINSTSDVVGPGIYDITKFDENNSRKKRIKYKDKHEEKENKKENIKQLYKKALQILKDRIGPGSYLNKNIYKDWRKKTFNITYL